jgi:peptidoglycan biosynthesis protein MviN/MurJ (putative lipid II flippase)
MIAGMIRRLAGENLETRRIASSAARILALVLCAKLLAVLREVVLAYHFGVSSVVDAYNVAFMVATFMPLLVAAAAGSALVPLLVALQRDPARQRPFLRELNGAAWLLALALLALIFLFGPAAGRLVGEGLDQSGRDLVAWMVRGLSLFTALSALAGYYAIRLQSEERFFYSFLEAMPALFLSIAVLLFAATFGPAALIAGTVAGGAVQLAWLLTLTRRSPAGHGGLAIGVSSPVWAAAWAGLGAMAVGQLLILLSVPMDQYFAGQAGAGGIAALGYANRIIGLLTGLGTIVLARALLPVFSAAVADGDQHIARREAIRWSVISLVLGLIVALVGWFAAGPAVRIVLERGAFDAEDTMIVADLLRLGLLQLPLYLGALVVVQLLASRGQYRLIAFNAGACILVKLVLLLLLTDLGVSGVMLSTVGMYAANFVLQLIALWRR